MCDTSIATPRTEDSSSPLLRLDHHGSVIREFKPIIKKRDLQASPPLQRSKRTEIVAGVNFTPAIGLSLGLPHPVSITLIRVR